MKRGRKYKPPPETSKITVQVTKKFNGKPIMNAAVIFNPFKDGKDIGNLEVKTDPEGKATIDIIPTGSLVRVQVIANGFATFAEDYQVDEAVRDIPIAMLRPQEQVSGLRGQHRQDVFPQSWRAGTCASEACRTSVRHRLKVGTTASQT